MAQWFFDSPAGVTDFTDPQHWHNEMAKEALDIIVLLVAENLGKNPKDVTQQDIDNIAPTLAYVNPLITPPPMSGEILPIAPWNAFPRAVERRAPWPFPHDPDDINGKYRAAEDLGTEDYGKGIFKDLDGNALQMPSRHRQDEYLEWVMRRNNEGKIIKAIFVAEGYDYYTKLFEKDTPLVVDMYKDFTGVNQITADDLRAKRGVVWHRADGKKTTVTKAGEFNPRNQLNINPGIVHLSHRANSLGAEVNLAGVSGVARKGVNGVTLQPGNAELLLCCSQGGNPNRNSDPLIGEQAYSQVLQKMHYTLANPVGLYIASVDDQRLTLPDATPVPREWWKVIRGKDLWSPNKSQVLRLELEVPAGENVILGDLLVDGNPIKYGGQIASLLSVHLFIMRWKRTDAGIGPVFNCLGTCCRKPGTPVLVPTDVPCPTGYDLAFPGLIPGAQPAIESLHGMDTISSFSKSRI